MSLIRYEQVHDGVVVISLNRPERLNAFNAAMLSELGKSFHAFDWDDSLNVAVLTGTGRAFSSGVDVQELADIGQRGNLEQLAQFQGVRRLLSSQTNFKPVLAAVHGYVLGMAVELVFQTDYVVAADTTQFQVTETKVGVSSGPIWPILQYHAGAAFASDVCISGRFFDAQEAYAHNLIGAFVVGNDRDCLSHAIERARLIANLPTESVRYSVRISRWYCERHQDLATPFIEAASSLALRPQSGESCRTNADAEDKRS